MPGDEFFDSVRLRNDLLLEPTWPRLSCSSANQLTFEFGELRFSNQRDGNTTHDWQINSATGDHKLAFNRTTRAVELHASGDVQVFTGVPAPSEKLRILANGNVGIGTTTPEGKLDVRGEVRAGNSDLYFTKTDHNHTGIGNAAGFAAIENGADYGALMILGRAGTAKGRTVKLWDYLEVNGPLDVRGELSFLNTGGGFARLSSQKYDNESSFQNNNVKLIMGSQGRFTLPSTPPLTYEFAIGNTKSGFRFDGGGFSGFTTTFTKVFSVNQRGDAYFAGAKTGYVVDHFVNRVGDTLEQGDVVIISQSQSTIFSGTDNDIPLLEADLTAQAYDTRVCGIVASVVTESDLPHVEIPLAPQDIAGQESEPSAATEPLDHPLKRFAAPVDENTNRKSVQDQQMGTMVTLGAYAHCKVDADIAPINAGDLLTTSPTRGHAQKVLDSSKAVGAILGKALGSLHAGKGKIPILVMLQ